MKEPYRLYRGDCFEILKDFPEETFDMIFADPPYMISNNGFTCKGGKVVSVNKGAWDVSKGIEQDFEYHKSWLKLCKRLLKPNGTLWVSGTYHSIYSCGFAMQLLGYHILNDISWFKPNASPNLSCRFFTASHENLIWARKDKSGKHTFNYENMRDGVFKNDFIKKENRQMRSVWVIPYASKSEKQHGHHPTQKPLSLLERVILSSTNKGDFILDPFMGSGTTGVVSIQLERKFVGIDVENEYFELAEKRISDSFRKKNNIKSFHVQNLDLSERIKK